MTAVPSLSPLSDQERAVIARVVDSAPPLRPQQLAEITSLIHAPETATARLAGREGK